ncbi:hypothetical protein AM231_25975 [Paenibacillus solani]|uniref:Uncharacterized protein n=1 Tax=Paenibacillus solani TaxID=1705565 RepID=A0A0M1N296_9BACL|nr:hypothetical protein AM231_25975 [Paenibacillus solani]
MGIEVEDDIPTRSAKGDIGSDPLHVLSALAVKKCACNHQEYGCSHFIYFVYSNRTTAALWMLFLRAPNLPASLKTDKFYNLQKCHKSLT